MNHYPHHIGDFNNATRHLTRTERSIYRDLLDLYYDTEKPLIADEKRLGRLILACTPEEIEALHTVLAEFFTLEADGWHNERCDAELLKYHSLLEKASFAGKASAAKRQQKTNASSTHAQPESNGRSTPVQRPFSDRSIYVQQKSNQPEPEPEPEPEPNINTEEEKKVEKKESPLAAIAASPPPHFSELPIAKAKPKRSQAIARPEGVADAVWQDWLALRSSKKAAVTQTVLAQARVEADKAGMSLNDFLTEWCLRGSQGLKAEWLLGDRGRQGGFAKPQGGTVNGVGVSATTIANVQAAQEYMRKKGKVFHAEIGSLPSGETAKRSDEVIDV